jgi:hypothetical protein
MDESKILFNKDGLQFIKLTKNTYKLQFQMENNTMDLSKIIDFSLIKLIYDLNPDIYEKVNVEKQNENEVIVTLLLKHFFEDLGLSQRFIFLHIQKFIENNKITFISSSIANYRPDGLPRDSELLDIKSMNTVCEVITPHKILFHFHIILNENLEVIEFVENLIGKIIYKIFNRVKQFIENVRM